jgi:hypothetical protein
MCSQVEQLKKEQLSRRSHSSANPIKTVISSNNNCSGNNHHLSHNNPGREGHSKKDSAKNRLSRLTNHFVEEMITADAEGDNQQDSNSDSEWEVLALNISPDLGERVMLSGERSLIEEAFPATGQVCKSRIH